MQWREDMPWGLGGEDSEIDADELELFMEKRKVRSLARDRISLLTMVDLQRLKTELDGVATIDPALFNNMIIGYIVDIYDTVQTRGSAAVPWQRAELAVYLTYIYGEIQRCESGLDVGLS